MTESMISDLFKQRTEWYDIKIGNDVYLTSTTRKNDITEVFLTNLIEIWFEKLSDEIILDRCKQLNPLLNVSALNCNEIVRGILNNVSKHVDGASVEQIKLRVRLEGGSLKFALNFAKGSPQQFWEIITRPLCISSMELIRQNKILVDLVRRKDEEIAEYKAEGAELIRKNIETETFKEEQLKVDIPIPKTVDYARAFQAMVNFYNVLNLYDHGEMSSRPSSNTSSSDKPGQAGQSVITPGDEGNINNGSTEGLDKDILMQKKSEILRLKSKRRSKNTSNEVTNEKRVPKSMVHKRVKQPKKSNFI